jgi:hypothetical protein
MATGHIWRNPSSSSAVVSYGYDPDQQTLAVEFAGGNVYHYPASPETFERFEAHPSKGKAVREVLRGNVGAKVDAPALADCPKCGDKGLAGYQCRDCGCADYGQL